MKGLTIVLLSLWSSQLFAGCEATMMTGSHTAPNRAEAERGALSDVSDICPAGKVTPTQLNCTEEPGNRALHTTVMYRCVQEAVCNLCGEDLSRKYETLE